jgi:endothelin-converting enzyme/putative endopeptidase
MRRSTFSLAAAFVLAAAWAAAQSSSSGPSRASSSGLELSSIDRSADACTDFYQFACGGWLAKNPIPEDRQRWGRFTELQERNFSVLRKILETPATGGDRQKAADYYAACMDEQTIESRKLKPIHAQLAKIAALRAKKDMAALVAGLHAMGVNVFFRFSSRTDLRDATRQDANIDQAGLGMPDRDYYLKTDNRSLELRQKYQRHLETMLGLLGEPPARAASGAQAILALETRLAEASGDRTVRRDPAATDHMMTVDEWLALTPAFDWRAYLAAIDAPAFDRLNVAAPAFVKALDSLIASTPLDELKEYLRWQLVNESAALLPRAFADADFDFYNRTLGGQQKQLPRWQRCVSQTDERLGEALGQAFVVEAFAGAAKSDTLAMVRAIKGAMRTDIEAAAWMSAESKRAAEAKLDAVVDRIGYPDKWKDYASVRIVRDDALGNMQRAIAFERRRDLKKIGQPVDRSEWSMTPPTVNAYYSSDRNTINFPAGILQPPFYQDGRDAAVNYGGAGAVVGHELTHGFDDRGRKFDGQGNLRDWWTPADAKAYEQRASCIADQYSTYVVAGDTHLNGKLTLGENTADNGGVRLALMAYLAGAGASAPPSLDGFTPEQRFFVSYGQIWCENRRPELERLRATTDPHSSARYRVNGVVSNMPEFQKAFACRADAPMVRQNACRVW